MNEMIILVSGLFFMYYIDIKYVLMIMVFVYILNDYTNIKTKFMKTINLDKRKESEYNSIVEDILGSLKVYSKKYKKQYKQGLYYWKKFIKTLKILEDKSLQNYNQYFDRAFDYLKHSVNHFQSISISIRERELLDGIKFNDFTNAKNTKEKISKLNVSVNIYDFQIKGKQYWRVVAGPASTSDSRENMLKDIKSAGFTDAYYVDN